MKRFLKNAGILASLAFCAFVLSNDTFAAGGSYGFNTSSITLSPGESASVSAIARPNDAGRYVAGGDASISTGSGSCASVVFTPTQFGSWGAGGIINVNNVSSTAGDLTIGVLSITAENVSASCSTESVISGGIADNQWDDYESSASVTINVVVSTPTPDPEPEKSSDNQITGLTSSAGSTTGEGDSWTVNDVPAGTSSISLTPSLPAGASVEGGSPVNCNLTGDTTSCSFVVKAEDGTPKTYAVTVNRKPEESKPENDDPSLKSISANNNVISGFRPEVTSYTINVGADVTSMDFSAVANDPNTTYTISGSNGWKTGANVVSVVATAKNGTKRVYTINVIRARATTDIKEEKKSDNNYLKSLVSHNGALNPDFDKNKTTYHVKVPRDVTKLNLSAIAEDEKAKIEIEGNENFELGKTSTVLVKVTAENGEQRIYTINVTREDAEAHTDLETLEVDGYEISPAYSKDIDKYSLTVPYNVDKIDVNAIPVDKDSRVTIIGNKDLAVGNNLVLVKVTDKNGYTHVYEINVRRQEEPTFLGIRRSIGWIIPLILGILLLFLLILWLLLRRRREREERAPAPTIEFNPAFNFGSRVGTDDDTVMPYGVNNQAETIPATNLAQPQRQAIAAGGFGDDDDDEEEPSVLVSEDNSRRISQPTTTASVTPTASGAANSTKMAANPAMMAAAAADASLDEMERRAEERAEMRAMRREVERLELERERLRKNSIEAEEVEASADDTDDDEVTKEDLLEAIEEVRDNHDATKLKLLMKQEELNRQKKNLQKTEAKQAARKTASAMQEAQDEYWESI